MGLNESNTTGLFSMACPCAEFQVVAAPDRVLVDVSAVNTDTLGYRVAEHALASLTTTDARRLSALLSEAIAIASPHDAEQIEDVRKIALWSGATSRKPVRRRVAR